MGSHCHVHGKRKTNNQNGKNRGFLWNTQKLSRSIYYKLSIVYFTIHYNIMISFMYFTVCLHIETDVHITHFDLSHRAFLVVFSPYVGGA